ncbi:MAG: glycosyltransferase family 4 protein [Methylococcaceae bacterium]|nr:glycosyltransferase family 4 protein [Methylococcaceae bacterium]
MASGWIGCLTAGGGALLAYVLTGRVLVYARRRLVDLPNARSSHRTPTPRGGGLAIVLAYALAVAALSLTGGIGFGQTMALAGGLPVAAIGFLDDHRSVSARWRMAVHLAAGVWALAWLGGLPDVDVNAQPFHLGILGTGLAVLFVVWMLNLFNFMDGIDGIAGAETVFVTTAGAVLSGFSQEAGMAAAMLAAATAGFLVWNWPPAKIFMGDVGSGFLGFILGVLAVSSARSGGLSLAVWLILSGSFFADAGITLLRRMLSGQRWYEAHRSHAYQHAAIRLGGHRPVTVGFLLLDLFWLLPLAAAAVAWPQQEVGLLLLAYAPLSFLAFRFDAGKAD